MVDGKNIPFTNEANLFLRVIDVWSIASDREHHFTEYGEVATSSRASEPTSSTPLSPYASFIQVGMLIEHVEII